MEVTDMTDSDSHKLFKSEVDADNEKKNTVADCDNRVTEFDMMLTAEECRQGTDDDKKCSEIAEANYKSTCCTSGTFQSLPGLKMEKTINNPEHCVNVTKSSYNHCIADKLWSPSDRTEHDAFSKEIEQKTDFVHNSGIDQVLSASDKVGLKSESGMFHDNNMDMIYVDSKSELLADMNETGVQDLNGLTSEYLIHPESSKNVVDESNTNLDAGDFDKLKLDSGALKLQYENHSEDNKSECGFEMDAHTAICSQYKLTDRKAAINESASDRVVDESLNPLSSVFYGKKKSSILASCNANQHENNGQESYAKSVATTDLPVISPVINTHHKTEEACIQTHCDSLHPVILPVIASDSRISQSEEEICEKTFEEIEVNEGCLEKVLNCEATDYMYVKTSEEAENVPDPPSEYLHEKDSCLAIFGTLLVIMCLNLYASSNEHVHARETDLMESSDDLGLDLLFKSETEEKGSRNPRRQVCVRSKAARKRKKQQQKLLPLLAKEKKKNKLKFAENFEDLKSAHNYVYCEDVDQTLTCPICLEMYYLPCLCQPCGHLFCDPCLRRLTGQGSEGILCPLCRTVIGSCVLDKEFNDQLRASHPEIYFTRHSVEKRSKYRHFLLPFTPPVPLSKRLLRQLVTNRPNLPLNQGTVHNCSKILFGCLVGACLSVLIMLFWKVRGIQSAKDVNIVFLSFFAGALVTVLVNKYLRF